MTEPLGYDLSLPNLREVELTFSLFLQILIGS